MVFGIKRPSLSLHPKIQCFENMPCVKDEKSYSFPDCDDFPDETGAPD